MFKYLLIGFECFIKKLLGEISSNPIFALPKEILAIRHSVRLTHGVMVTLLILVQSFKVRILMGQQKAGC